MTSHPGLVPNEVLRFTLELAALVALSAWGWHTGTGLLQRLPLATAAPLLAALAWGQFVAPRAPRYLARPGRLVIEAAVFVSATLALSELGHPLLASTFALVATLNTALIHLLGQDSAARAEAGAPRKQGGR